MFTVNLPGIGLLEPNFRGHATGLGLASRRRPRESHRVSNCSQRPRGRIETSDALCRRTRRTRSSPPASSSVRPAGALVRLRGASGSTGDLLGRPKQPHCSTTATTTSIVPTPAPSPRLSTLSHERLSTVFDDNRRERNGIRF